MASTKDENQEPADVAASCLGDEVRCIALEPAHNASTLVKAEKLVGEKVKSEIESIVLEAAHNACKPGCDGGEDKNKGEGWREQGCGVLEAKVGLL